MQKSPLILTIETIVWIAIAYFARHLLDLAAARWNIQALWLFFLKIIAVLALIAIAVGLHGRLLRALVRLGWLPRQEEQPGHEEPPRQEKLPREKKDR